MSENLSRLLRQKNKSLLFAGIGNILKSDDGVGVYLSSQIKQSKRIFALTVEVSIENYIGKINSINPDILVLIDCVELQAPPGTHKLMSISHVQDNTFTTHNISLKRISDFFKMRVFLLGIQPENVEFGENISRPVKDKADKIIKLINSY